MKIKLTLDEVRELLGKTDGDLHAKLQAALDAAPIETYEEGACVRCGKTVTRSPDAQRWTDRYGRDRCRADMDDDQCDVREIAHLSGRAPGGPPLPRSRSTARTPKVRPPWYSASQLQRAPGLTEHSRSR